MEHTPHISLPIKLNVGGHHFTTSVQTLTNDPNSMLAAMFSGNFEMKPCEDGSFFIDRDGTHFRFILNYLRTGKLTLPERATFLKELEEEAEFYQMEGLVEELKLISREISTVVNLNVGGLHYTTSVQTLNKDPNSVLAAMLAGHFDVKRSREGTYIIDRDGKHFRFILNYLRNGELSLPEEEIFLKEFEVEAKFYQIQGILNKLRLNSEILTNEEHRRMLLDWLPPQGGECRVLRLLFRASRDGFAAATFHKRCDNKGATVTIVKSGNNIFGGFTETSWNSLGGYMRCKEAFLFSMVNQHGLGPTKMPLKSREQNDAIVFDPSSGPTFGLRHELHIPENANIYPSTCFNLGHTYESPPGQQNPFCIRDYVTNYEVFALHY